jgi:hypothetical protein
VGMGYVSVNWEKTGRFARLVSFGESRVSVCLSCLFLSSICVSVFLMIIVTFSLDGVFTSSRSSSSSRTR